MRSSGHIADYIAADIASIEAAVTQTQALLSSKNHSEYIVKEEMDIGHITVFYHSHLQ